MLGTLSSRSNNSRESGTLVEGNNYYNREGKWTIKSFIQPSACTGKQFSSLILWLLPFLTNHPFSSIPLFLFYLTTGLSAALSLALLA